MTASKKRLRRQIGQRLEWLEDRCVLATFAGSLGNPLAIGLTASSSSLSISANAGTYTLTLSGGDTWSSSNIGTNAVASGATLTVTKDAFSALNITDSAAVTGVTFATSGANTYTDDVTVNLNNAASTITFNGNTSFASASSLNATTIGGILVSSSAAVSTVNGDLTLSGNQTGPSTVGAFAGVKVDSNAVVQATGTGEVTVLGRGGNDSATQIGVWINSGARIIGGTSGVTTVTGTSGTSSAGFNYGVLLVGTGTAITSNGASVDVSGTSEGTGSGSSNYGVYLINGGQIQAGGSGTVTVFGKGATAATGDTNYGVYVTSSPSAITSSGGAVSVTGEGGGSGTSSQNHGIVLQSSAQISAGSGGTVFVDGTGGGTSGSTNYGVFLIFSASIQSAGGSVTVNGLGGGTGTSSNNQGIRIEQSSQISAGGTGAVSVNGTGSPVATGIQNTGIWMQDSGSTVTSSGGNVTVTGIEGNSGSSRSIEMQGASTITTATSGGTITLIGNSVTIGTSANISALNSSSVTVRQYTNGVGIVLGSGSDTTGGPLNLIDPELDRITAGTIYIGDSNSGTITVSGGVTSNTNLVLTSGASIASGGGSLSTTGAAITLNTSGAIGTAANRITFGDNPNTGQQNVIIGSVTQASSVFLDGNGNLTLGNISGGTANTSIDVTARASLVVAANATINSGTSSLSLGADLTAAGAGDNGAGTLTISAGASVSGRNLTLRGADAEIDGTANVTSSGDVTIRSSVATRPISLGGANNAVSGINLTDAELARISSSAAGTVTVGDSSQSGDITLTTVRVATTAGAATTLTQSTAGNGKIVLNNEAGAAASLNGNTGTVRLSSGNGGIVEAATNTTGATDITGASTTSLVSASWIGTSSLPIQIGTTNLNSTSTASDQFLRATGAVTIDATGLSAGAGIVEFDGGTFTLGGSGRIADTTRINVNGATFAMSTFNESVNTVTLTSGSITGTGTLTSLNTIQVQSGTINPILATTNGLTKSTTGTVTLTGANTYSGETAILGGTLALSAASNNNIASSTPINIGPTGTLDVTGLTGSQLSLASGRSLQGTGLVSGRVTATTGSSISPSGVTTGILSINNGAAAGLSLQNGSTFTAQVNGNVAGTGYDQINVTGTVSLGGSLSTSGTVTSSPNQQIVLINNDGTDAVTGTFNGLPEGSAVTINGVPFTLSYVGGTNGNDVVLTQGGPVTYTATAASEDIELRQALIGGLNYIQYIVDGVLVDQRLTSSVSSIQIDGGTGNDTLTIDYTGTGGFFALPVTFNGGENAGDNDVLTVIGNGTQTALYTPNAATNGNGTVSINGSTLITFTQLEPINVTGMATFVLSLPGANDNVTITETTALGNAALALSGTSGGVGFETANVWNNTNVVINTTLVTNGNDTITVTSAANAHANTNLSIITGTGTDAIDINGNISVTGTLSLSTSDNVTQTGSITAAGLALLGSGSYVLTNPANAVGTLAADTNAISYRDTDALVVGSLTTTTNVGVTTTTTGVTTSADNVTIQTGTTLLITNNVTIGAAVLTLNSGGATTQGAGNISATGGGLELIGVGPYTLTNAGNNVANFAANTNAVSYRDADGLTITTVGGTSGITTSNDNVTVQTGGTLAISSAISIGTGNLTLNTAGATTQTAAITAQGLELLGTGDKTLNSANDVDNLAGSAGGAISFTDSDGFDVTTVNTAGLSAGTTLSLTATTGNISIVNTAAANDLNAAGLITITLSANNALFTINTTADVETSTGGVTISADRMNLAGSITATAGTQIVTLQNSSGVDAIDLGSTTDANPNTLELSDGEIDRIAVAATGMLRIGTATMGAISITQPINLNLANSATILSLRSGSTVGQTGTGSITVASLAITAGGAVSMSTNPNSVTTLSIDTSTGAVTFTDASGIVVGTVDNVLGIDTDNGGVTLVAQSGNVTVNDTTAANDIDATAAVLITLQGDNAVFTVSASADVETTAGGITINADEMILDGSITATTGSQTIRLRPFETGEQINLGSTGSAADDVLELSNGELTRVTVATTGVIQIGRNDASASGDITFSGLINRTTVSTFHLFTGAAVVDLNGGNDFTGPSGMSLAIDSVSGIADGNTLETVVSNLAFNNTTSNRVQISNTGALTITSIDGIATSSNGAVARTQLDTTGSITIAVNTTSGGDLAVEALGTAAANTENFTVNAGVTVRSTAGSVNLRAGDRMTLTNTSTILSDVSDIFLTSGVADGDNDGSMTINGLIQANNSATTRVTINLSAAPGAATQGITGTLLAGQLRLLSTAAAGGSFAMATSTTNDVGIIGADTSGTIAYRDVNNLVIGNTLTVGITTSNDDVQLFTGGTLLVDDDVNLGTGDLGLSAGAEVTQNSGDTITANGLALTNAGPFTLTDPGNSVATIAASTAATANNTINYVDVNSLIVGSVDVLGTITTGITTTGDDVRLTATTGGFTISSNINLNSGGAGGAGGDLELTATTGATQTAPILAAGLALRGTGASINTNRYILTNTGNDVAAISGAMTRGHVVYIDLNDLTVDDVTVTTGAAAPITVTTTGLSVGNDVGSVDVDPDAGGPGGGDIVLRAGITLANVILTLSSILTVTTGNPISTTSGTGGDVLIGGGVELNAALNLGSGDIDLGGSAPDICIDTATVITLAPANSTATLQPIGNIIVHESLSTVGGDLTLIADADNNGTGGIWVRDNGRIDADGALFLYGSELTAATCGTPAVPTVGIQIDNTSVAIEINANTAIVIETKTNSVAGGSNDDTVLDGNVHSEGGGSISIAAENRIVQNSTSTVDLSSAGNIYYQANDIVIDTASAVINAQAGGIVHLRNRSAGLPINLGSTASTASGAVATTLSISNPELNRISTVSAVRIGFNSAFASSPNTPNVLTTAGNAGTITVTAANINVLNSTVLHLITGTNIVDDGTGGVGTITETNLALEAETGIDLDNVNAVPGVSGNDVDNLAIRLTGNAAGNDAAFKDVDDLNFAVVDNVASPAAVSVVGDLTLIAGGAVTQSAAIITGGLELIDLFNDPNPPLTFLAFPNYYLPNSSNQIGRLEAYSQRSVNITNSIAIAVDVVANTFRAFPAPGASGIWVQSLQLTAPTVIVNSPIETNDELGFVTFDVTTLLDINANIFSRGKIEQIGTGVVTVDDVQLRTTDDNITFLGGVTLDGPLLTTPTLMSTDAGWTTPFTGIPLAADAAAQTGAGSVIFNSTLRSNPSGDTAAAYRGNDLTLETGTGNIQFIGQVGGASGAAGRLGVVNIVDAHDVTASTGFSANAFYQQAGDGETAFNGFVQTNGRRDVLTPTAATNFGIDITTKMITLNAAMQTTSAPGSGAAAAIRLNNSGTMSIVAGAGSINSDGAVSQVGTGNNLVGGDIVTTNDNISFASDTYLSGGPLQINSGNADVSFAARFQVNNKTVTIRDKDFVDLGTVTAIAGGVLNVFVANTATRGSIQAGSGETITGAGTINADVSVLTGGTLAPAMDASGLGTGILTINGNVVLGTNAVYAVDLNGTSAGASYDQVVTGATFTFTATGAILSATRPVTFNPATGSVLKIIDGSVDVVGNFSNATNGTFVYINGLYFRVDYDVTAGDLTLTRQDPPGAAVTIIDDNGSSPSTPVAGFTLSPNNTTAWSPNSVAGRGYGNDLRFAAAGNGSSTALYTFTGLIAGHTYRVSTTWYPHINRATDSPFTVDDGAGGSAAVTTTINQRNNPDDFTSGGSAWEDLVVGGYTISGTTLTVLLTNNTSTGYVIADAVRIEDITGAAPEIVVMDGTTDIPDGTGVVDFGTTSTLGADISKVISIKNTGLSPLVLSSATITPPPGFTITGYTPQTIAPGATGTPFTITLSHLVAGSFSGQISFNTNDFDENPFNFTVKGGVTSGLTQIADNLSLGGGGYNTITGSANNAGTNLMYGEVGLWHNNDDSLVGYQQDLRYAQANSNSQATWTFSGLAAGTYRVSVTFRAEPNRASNASFTVTGTGVVNPTVVSINQRVAPNQFQDANVYWIDLDGAFGTVSAGGTITVTLDALGSNGFVIADAVRVEFLHALQAEDGPAANPTATVLTTADLDATAAAAVARWQQAGLTAAQQATLNGLIFAVANLPDAYLGGETDGTIFVDANAAGYGWYVDSTPNDDTEFGLMIADTELGATDPLAVGHMDLLTVLMHEIGHRLGLDDVPITAGDHGLMTESLDVATRRLPTGISVSEGKTGVEDVSTDSSATVADNVQDEVFVNLGATDTSAPTTAAPTIAIGGSSSGSQGNHHGSGHSTGSTHAGNRHHRTGGKPHNDANESRSLLGTLFNLVRKRR